MTSLEFAVYQAIYVGDSYHNLGSAILEYCDHSPQASLYAVALGAGWRTLTFPCRIHGFSDKALVAKEAKAHLSCCGGCYWDVRGTQLGVSSCRQKNTHWDVGMIPKLWTPQVWRDYEITLMWGGWSTVYMNNLYLNVKGLCAFNFVHCLGWCHIISYNDPWKLVDLDAPNFETHPDPCYPIENRGEGKVAFGSVLWSKHLDVSLKIQDIQIFWFKFYVYVSIYVDMTQMLHVWNIYLHLT